MALKTRKLTLEYHPVSIPCGNYKVVRIEHSTEFNPGDRLDKNKVDELNSKSYWHVVIVGRKAA